ncbi:hypothetical protein ATANTOWER_027746 [Ataeniobius toweri]|uniref:Uncharacterized protein n=1 Tax=Ataeniobius toweri TaxID=208326 RepID=A0ABU7A9T3_9TELE|nr:hypothetical protein [Ataeniobius toweri]
MCGEEPPGYHRFIGDGCPKTEASHPGRSKRSPFIRRSCKILSWLFFRVTNIFFCLESKFLRSKIADSNLSHQQTREKGYRDAGRLCINPRSKFTPELSRSKANTKICSQKHERKKITEVTQRFWIKSSGQ